MIVVGFGFRHPPGSSTSAERGLTNGAHKIDHGRIPRTLFRHGGHVFKISPMLTKYSLLHVLKIKHKEVSELAHTLKALYFLYNFFHFHSQKVSIIFHSWQQTVYCCLFSNYHRNSSIMLKNNLSPKHNHFNILFLSKLYSCLFHSSNCSINIILCSIFFT